MRKGVVSRFNIRQDRLQHNPGFRDNRVPVAYAHLKPTVTFAQLIVEKNADTETNERQKLKNYKLPNEVSEGKLSSKLTKPKKEKKYY
jgi:hypothetical protein